MSSIYIKGRKPPNSCDDCWVSDCPNDEHIDGYRMMERPTYCPIIAVPDHGRLGDLDDLAQQIEHERFHHMHTDGLAARHHVAEYGHFLKAISEAPTIIEADREDKV